MNLVQRVQDILLKPKETWPAIEAENTDTATLYKGYLAILAAIPAVAGFIGSTMVGRSAFGFSYRAPIVSGLVSGIVMYVVSLALIYGLSLIADALAPSFGGSKNQNNALKLVAYSYTASFVAGVLSIVPMLGMLAVLGSLYGIYLLYLGTPVLMKVPEEKAPGYVAVLVVCGIVASMVIGGVVGMLTMGSMMGQMAHGGSGGEFSVKTPDGQVTIDTAKLQEAAKRIEAASKQAQASGDPADAGKVAAAALGVSGKPFAPQDLKAVLPDTLGGLPRASIESEGTGAMGFNVSIASARYQADGKQLEMKISDFGGGGGLLSFAAWANLTMDKETDTSVEKIYKQGSRSVREQYQKDGSRAEYTLVLANGVIVETHATGIAAPAVKEAIGTVDLGKLEAMKHAPAG
ncbi:Yip1 family protein [Chitinimonas sp.]|uniref:Yip1 family protein n=1 Tax=Chitinimonas sp. TaxID=1934313 RepID=UPI0035B08C75